MKHLPDYTTPMPFLTNVFLKHILGLLVCDPFFFSLFFLLIFPFEEGLVMIFEMFMQLIFALIV